MVRSSFTNHLSLCIPQYKILYLEERIQNEIDNNDSKISTLRDLSQAIISFISIMKLETVKGFALKFFLLE
jgi:hypothetical protein